MNRPAGTFDSIPNVDWLRATLGDDIELISGVHIDAADYHGGPEGIPYITGPSDFANGVIRKTKFTDAPAVFCESGDILLTVKGSGTGSLMRADSRYCISRQLMAIRTRTWCQDFIYYVLSAHSTEYQAVAAGLIPGITREHVLGTPLRVPPHAEQKAIAGVLYTWDRAIRQTARLIAAKERLKQGLMQQLLSGKRRLRKFHEPWHGFRLGDLFTERRECGVSSLPTLSVTLDLGVIRREQLDKPVRTSLGHEQHLLVRKGDIAYNMMRMWQGGSGVALEDGVVSPAYVVCVPSRRIDSRFAYHLFRSPRLIYLFWAYSYGLTDDRRRLYYDEFARIPVSIPSLEEQTRIAAVIDALDAELFLLAQRRESIQKQKRGPDAATVDWQGPRAEIASAEGAKS